MLFFNQRQTVSPAYHLMTNTVESLYTHIRNKFDATVNPHFNCNFFVFTLVIEREMSYKKMLIWRRRELQKIRVCFFEEEYNIKGKHARLTVWSNQREKLKLTNLTGMSLHESFCKRLHPTKTGIRWFNFIRRHLFRYNSSRETTFPRFSMLLPVTNVLHISETFTFGRISNSFWNSVSSLFVSNSLFL